MIGEPGLGAVLLNLTNASSISRLRGSLRFSGTNNRPNSASTFSFFEFSKTYDSIFKSPAFSCAGQTPNGTRTITAANKSFTPLRKFTFLKLQSFGITYEGNTPHASLL